MSHGHGPHRSERGIILVAVLLAVTIMSVMVVAVSALARSGIGSERLETRLLASRLALRSALEAAKAEILATPPAERAFLNGEPLLIDAGAGVSAIISIRDASGLVDLNRASPALIEAQARASGLDAKGLGDRLAALRQPPAATGAAPAKPESPPKPGAQDNGKPAEVPVTILFQALSQFAELADAGSEEREELARRFTLYSPMAQVNPLAAPDDVLAAVPGLAEGDVSMIESVRQARNWKSNANFMQMLDRMKEVLAVKEPVSFLVEVKLDSGDGIIIGSAVSAALLVSPDGPLPFRTLALAQQ